MKMTLTLGIAIVLSVATVSAGDDARLPGAETVCGSLTVTLRDGSKLLGRPLDFDALPTLSGAEKVEIPLVKIVSFKMKDDRVSAVIGLEGGSRLVAIIPVDSIRLETSIGRLSLPLAEIASCQVSTAVVTSGNVALASHGASVSGVFDGGSGPALIDGNTTDYDSSTGFAHLVGLPASWVITLPQTCLLREIRLLLWDGDDRYYRYRVETSTDGQSYRTAADRSHGEWRSWQKLTFPPRPVRFIRLKGLYYSRIAGAAGMHVVELEAYCHSEERSTTTKNPLLWNKLGSKKEAHESEVGPGGTYSGEGGRFVEGRFGGALSATAEEIHYQQPALVTFPKEVISTDAGCVEIWAKLDGFPKALKWGENPALLKIHEGTCSYIIHLNGNDGGSKGGLCGRAGGNSSAGTGVFGTWTYEQVLGPGQVEQWHHYALVWDKDGIPGVDDGTRTIALFLDGKLNSQEWRTGQRPWVNNLTGGELRLLLNHHLSQGSVALDNLKIWNYAKTDFSDRFVEGIEPR